MPAPICPVCESHLTGDAVREGRCQCCGTPLPKAEPKPEMTEEEQPQ